MASIQKGKQKKWDASDAERGKNKGKGCYIAHLPLNNWSTKSNNSGRNEIYKSSVEANLAVNKFSWASFFPSWVLTGLCFVRFVTSHKGCFRLSQSQRFSDTAAALRAEDISLRSLNPSVQHLRDRWLITCQRCQVMWQKIVKELRKNDKTYKQTVCSLPARLWFAGGGQIGLYLLGLYLSPSDWKQVIPAD